MDNIFVTEWLLMTATLFVPGSQDGGVMHVVSVTKVLNAQLACM